MSARHLMSACPHVIGHPSPAARIPPQLQLCSAASHCSFGLGSSARSYCPLLLTVVLGLLRCGKSCRLRWLNYLKPSIKRGNFTKDEEETIIRLHEQLGNRWSAIAAELPGRTDNEIKNVWNMHLKKGLKLNQLQTAKKVKAKTRGKARAEFMPVIGDADQAKSKEHTSDAVPALQSYSEMSSSGTISSSVNRNPTTQI